MCSSKNSKAVVSESSEAAAERGKLGDQASDQRFPRHTCAGRRAASRACGLRTQLGLLAATGLLLLSGLGATDLWAPDEPRYAQVAEEMRSFRHGVAGLVLLHLNDEVYTQKPPLYYWLAALFGTTSGRVGEISARLPSALAGIGCVALTLMLGRRLFSTRSAGLWGAALLVTTYRFAHWSRRAQLDVLLTLFELIALLAFWQLQSDTSDARRSRRMLALLHGATGLALLTKGPVGLLPFLIIVIYLAWERRLRDLPSLFPLWGLCLSLGPPLLWLGSAVALAPSGFFSDAVLDNVLARFLSGTAHIRPFYYFFYQFPIDFLPWTLLWPLAAVTAARQLRRPAAEQQNKEEQRAWRFLLVWLGTMFVFFSLSSGKRGLYLLPAFPATALLCGGALAVYLSQRTAARWLERSLLVLLTALGLAGAVLALSPELELPGAPGFALPPRFGLALAGIVMLVFALRVAAIRRGAGASVRQCILAAGVLLVELCTFTLLYPALDSEKSPRPIAEAAADITQTHDLIGVYRHRALAGGIAYYSHRPTIALEAPAEVERFVAEGGRAIIVKARHFAALSRTTPLAIRAQARHGRRTIVLAEPKPPHSDER